MARPSQVAARIEVLIAEERWAETRRLIRGLLKERPDNHFMLSRLALTHYEQRNYWRAMKLERRALVLAPHCPLALWGLAGTNHMLGHLEEASRIYRCLIRRGAPRLARGRCGREFAKLAAWSRTAGSGSDRFENLRAIPRGRRWRTASILVCGHLADSNVPAPLTSVAISKPFGGRGETPNPAGTGCRHDYRFTLPVVSPAKTVCAVGDRDLIEQGLVQHQRDGD